MSITDVSITDISIRCISISIILVSLIFTHGLYPITINYQPLVISYYTLGNGYHPTMEPCDIAYLVMDIARMISCQTCHIWATMVSRSENELQMASRLSISVLIYLLLYCYYVCFVSVIYLSSLLLSLCVLFLFLLVLHV